MAATEVKVPNIGDFKDIPVIELLVKAGDTVKKDDSLLVLESDKATLEVPAPAAGVISELKVKIGDKVSAGTLVALARREQRRRARGDQRQREGQSGGAGARGAAVVAPRRRRLRRAARAAAAAPAPAVAAAPSESPGAIAHASPGVRRFARELGVPLAQVTGSGPKSRILKEDIQAFVKQSLAGGVSARARRRLGRSGSPALAQGRLRQVRPDRSAAAARASRRSRRPGLARNWVMIPHVTQFDEADITELEAFRAHVNEENAKSRREGVAARLPDEGGRRGAEEVPHGQQLPRRREPDPQAVLEHRLRRRHAAGAGGAGDQGRRQEGDPRHRQGDHRAGGQGARRQARPERHPGRDVHHLVAGRDRRHRLHPHHQRARGRHPGRLQGRR